MGHRTLVAYDRDGYDLHYAHWGVDPGAIAPGTPYGGAPDDGWLRACAARAIDPAAGRLFEDRDAAVDPEPLATDLSFAEVCARIDPVEHEALHVVTPDYEVRPYLVLGLRTDGDRHRTALVRYEDAADAAYLRGWLAGARAVCAVKGGGIDADDGPVVAALRWLDPARGAVVYPAAEPFR